MGNLMKILKCNLYDGEPYMTEKDGKYHVMQGSMQKSDVQVWRDTVEEAVERWNHRLANCTLKGETVSVEIL